MRSVTSPGDVVAVESPTYFGSLQQIEEFGLKALEIPMCPRTGMSLDALEVALRKRRISTCLSVPNFSNPMGSLMPDENKRRLVELLGKYDIPLIEDDINGELYHHGDRPCAAQSFDDEGRVMLCGSFSKTLAPGYRVGWLVPGRYYDRVLKLKFTNTLATGTLPQLAIAKLMANGGHDHYLRSLRHKFAIEIDQMSNAVVEAFPPGIKLSCPTGGFLLWIELPKQVLALKLHEYALANKISTAPGPMFSAIKGFPNFIWINCGNPWSAEIQRAVGTLGTLTKRLM